MNFNFVIECPLYTDIRIKCINKYSREQPSMLKFIELLRTDSVKVMKILSIYVDKAFQMRKENMLR